MYVMRVRKEFVLYCKSVGVHKKIRFYTDL